MSRLETSTERDCVDVMEEGGWLQLKGDAAAEKQGGLSDRFFFGYGGRTVLIEFKREGYDRGRRGQRRQDWMREQFRGRGFECHKPETDEEAKALCRRLAEENYSAWRSEEESAP